MLVRSKAPLRLGFAGGGTDVSPYSDEYGGSVLNATIDMYAYCTLEPLERPVVAFHAADRDEVFECEAAPYIPLIGQLGIHKGIYNRVVRDFNHGKPLPLRITTYSDAPAGSGLGSSSTMVVAMLKAYQEYLNLPLGDYDLAHLAYEIERLEVGLSGGKQDQYAATFGGFNFIEFYADDRVVVNPLRVKNWIVNELENSLVLFYTGTSRESANIINEQSRNARTHNPGSIQAMHELKNDSVLMKEHLLKGDIARFAELMGKSWNAKKRMASGISNPHIDRVYDVAMGNGAWAGKVTGAGGGGFMMFLVDPVDRRNIVRKLSEFQGQVINAHFSFVGTQSWKI